MIPLDDFADLVGSRLPQVCIEPGDTRPEAERSPLRPIDTLLAELAATITELERHTGDTCGGGLQSWYAPHKDNCGNSELDPRKLRSHPFTDGATGIVGDLGDRLAEVSSVLSSAETLRLNWAGMGTSEKRRYIRELENGDEHGQHKAMVQALEAQEVRQRQQEDRRQLQADVATGRLAGHQLERLQRLNERAEHEGWED
jgi:hypothetical protein